MYSLRSDRRKLETRYKLKTAEPFRINSLGCNVVFKKIGARFNDNTGKVQTSLWRINCRGCDGVLRIIFEVELERT